MTRVQSGLCGVLAVCAMAHLGYSLMQRIGVPAGTYYAEGMLLTSDARPIPIKTRLHSTGNDIYDFIQADAWYIDFFRKIDDTLLGGMKLTTIRADTSTDQSAPPHNDEDAVFNKAYISKAGARLTLYPILRQQGIFCFYVRELTKIRCFGPNSAQTIRTDR